MTMPRAVALLILSSLVTALGVFLLVVRINSGLVNSEISSRSTGAFIGENAATPEGSDRSNPGGVSRGNAAATITATIRQITSVAATASAVLTPLSGTPGAGAGSAVAVGQPVTVGTSRFTVHQVLDPEPPGTFQTTSGNRRIGIEITQEALTGSQQYHFAQFRVRDTNGKLYTWAIANGDPQFSVGTIQAGESRRGWLSFQVPVGVPVDALVFQGLTQSAGTAIVDLRK